MKTDKLIKNLADKTFFEWGDGYGYNGSPIRAKYKFVVQLKSLILKVADKSFTAGRSKKSYVILRQELGL